MENIAGPIDSIGKDEFQYVINFIDKYSGYTFYYCLKQISDTVKGIKNVLWI